LLRTFEESAPPEFIYLFVGSIFKQKTLCNEGGNFKMYRILVGGAGGTPANNYIKCLKKAGGFYVIGTTSNKYDVFKSLADESYYLPPARDSSYLEAFQQIVDETRPDFAYPSHDFEVQTLSDNRSVLDDLSIRYFWPSQKTVNSCVDKGKSAAIWQEAGIKVPNTILVSDYEDLKKAFDAFGGDVWLRAREGGGGYGALPTSNISFAKAWIDQFNGWGKFTAAELLTPESITWSSIWLNGELLVAQTRKRLFWAFANRTLSGVTGITGAAVTCDDSIVDDIALKSILSIDERPNGIFSVDMTYDNEGVPNPTEINIGRFFTTIDFFERMGLNMPYIFTMAGLGKLDKSILPRKKVNPLTPGKCWIRGMDVEPVLVDLEKIDLVERR